MSLRDIRISISYKSKGKDNIADALIVPALKQTKIYKRSVGFFSSSVFELTRAGLNSLIEQGGEYRIICSPELSDADIEAIQTGYEI